MEIDRFDCLVRLEIMWAQDPKSSPPIFLETQVGTKMRIMSSTIVTSPHQFLRKTFNTTHTNFNFEIWLGLNINMVHINCLLEN